MTLVTMVTVASAQFIGVVVLYARELHPDEYPAPTIQLGAESTYLPPHGATKFD